MSKPIFSQIPSEKECRAIQRQAERDRALYLAGLARRAMGALVGPFRG